MRYANTLVSVGLPVRNGADRIETVVKSVLNQDHENLELVICDNASTDDTEELCRGFAAQDSRIVYHRHPINVGLFNNFVSAMRLATGMFFRWVGDDDWLDPRCISRSLDAFAVDDGLLLVTTQICYTGPDGVTHTATYDGTALRSDDPVTRFAEMLRLLNESYLLMDPLYGMFRREPVLRIERRNMLFEDQVFATKLALAGPWARVPEVLAWRNWKQERLPSQARTVDVPSWQVHFATALQCKEMLRWLDKCDLDERQRRKARSAVARMYMRRQRLLVARRSRKLLGIARELSSRPLTRSVRSASRSTAVSRSAEGV
jgi:cellulose synthase/poly-beta-1,6-N-acetylglucosamine synthase-like glycosyltransferase